ncbi:PREDICTED: uncharacterized protein LOC109239542 [Nicotiana attenuata]|uniref:uncharacterized protein LOC109239542 n=1 Tax=Nicotiana attenuata TaxID=49451 RepID=UPI0009046696|nr:PREDICTED: uncharacterized protein LOC109239542 [Nicotiana attenuata]
MARRVRDELSEAQDYIGYNPRVGVIGWDPESLGGVSGVIGSFWATLDAGLLMSSVVLRIREEPLAFAKKSSLLERIMAHQFDDPHLLVLKDTVQRGGAKEVAVGDDDVMRLQGQICVRNIDGLRELILEEAHSSRYSIHPGDTKMYSDLKQHNWRQ